MPYKDIVKKRRVEIERYYSNREKILEHKRIYYIENRDRIQAYRHANRDKRRASDRKRYWANRESQLKRHAEYRAKNREKHLESMRQWRLRNPKYTTKHYAKNPGKCLAYYAKRRALKRNSTVGDITAIEKIYERARELRQWFNVVVDHIVPLSRGGAHSVENLQIIYKTDNLKKFCRLDYKPSVIFS